MSRYSTDPLWADITPLPTSEGGPNPLAAIAYSASYEEATSYLRAVMASNELSPRALALTEDLIASNPAHYTVWLYRFQCLRALNSDLEQEREWLNETALQHQKNYQIWHHRHSIVDALGSAEGESEFVERMFERDAKNYHVWSYRQWLVRRFDLWDEGELEFTARMIGRDVRNNSAWNHRWFVVNGRRADEGSNSTTRPSAGTGSSNSSNSSSSSGGVAHDPALRARELAFAQQAILKAPHNESPWNYLRAIARASGMALSDLRGFVEEYASLERPEEVRTSYALDLLAEILAEDEEGKKKAGQAFDLLAERYDPIRRNYWEYRKGVLGVAVA